MMRSPRLAARLAFAERFTFAVIERPFLNALQRVSALPLGRHHEAEPDARTVAPPELPHAA